MPGHTHQNSLDQPVGAYLMFICMQKNQFHPSLVCGDMQSYYKLAILGTLGIPSYGQ